MKIRYSGLIKMEHICLLLSCMLLNYGEAGELSPTLIDSPPKEVPTPNISQEDIVKALTYGREQREVRIKEEDEYVSKGHNITRTVKSAPARGFPPIVPKTMLLHRSRLELEDATKWIAKKYNLTKDQITLGLPNIELPKDHPVVQECWKLQETPPCDVTSKYRTPDGSCNNLENPTWGWATACYTKLLTPAYDDGFSSPRFHEGSSILPNVRLISTTISDDVNLTSKDFTQMLLSFGQFVSHDTIQSVIGGSGENADLPDCCSSGKLPSYCIPMEIPKNDYYFSKQNRRCLNAVRTPACSPDCKLGSPRRQVTQQTGFLDGSQIYGPSLEENMALRSMKGGELKIQKTKFGNLLPPSFFPDIDQCTAPEENLTCFQTGDFRSSFHPGLTAMHIVFVREHNRIAKILSSDYPQATDEEIFQETRRLVGALQQKIAFDELLPTLIGLSLMNYFNLTISKEGFTTYDPHTNPTVFSEYSGACTRYGHTLLQQIFQEYAENSIPDGGLDLSENIFHPKCFFSGQMDSVTRGLYHQGEQGFDRHFISSMTNRLLEVPGKNDGGDIVALNSQRGRDMGLPSYSKVLHYCYNVTVSSFKDLSLVMNEDSWKALQRVYSSVNDIDLYTGGFSERPVKDSVLGHTWSCIVGKQFHNLKYGDRFYFEHEKQTGSFSEAQLKEIRKVTLSQVICSNTEIKQITPNVLRTVTDSNSLVDCSSIEKPDLTKWLDK